MNLAYAENNIIDLRSNKSGADGKNAQILLCEFKNIKDYYFVSVNESEMFRVKKSKRLLIATSATDGASSSDGNGENGGNAGFVQIETNSEKLLSKVAIANLPGRGGNGGIGYSHSESSSYRPTLLMSIFRRGYSSSYSESKNSGAKGSDGYEGKVSISTDGTESCQELYDAYEFTFSKLN